MCARRDDVIAIRGADEDLTYLGHICGPYEMTFRLMNFGWRLVWATDEYMYHTWHPGSDGTDNYFGPHDGLHMSTIALQALTSGRVVPLVENEAIRRMRTDLPQCAPADLEACLIDPSYRRAFHVSKPNGGTTQPAAVSTVRVSRELYGSYRGHEVYQIGSQFYGVPPQMGPVGSTAFAWRNDRRILKADTFSAIQQGVDMWEARWIETTGGRAIYHHENLDAIRTGRTRGTHRRSSSGPWQRIYQSRIWRISVWVGGILAGGKAPGR
jgi:hypothetical protein